MLAALALAAKWRVAERGPACRSERTEDERSIATPPGGHDLYGRLIARYPDAYLPGNPTLAAQTGAPPRRPS
jgi:hypothetical protein